MNKNIIKGNKNAIMSEIRKHWEDFSSEEIDQIINRYDERLNKSQKFLKEYKEKIKCLNH